jgi:hypothetical protein
MGSSNWDENNPEYDVNGNLKVSYPFRRRPSPQGYGQMDDSEDEDEDDEEGDYEDYNDDSDDTCAEDADDEGDFDVPVKFEHEVESGFKSPSSEGFTLLDAGCAECGRDLVPGKTYLAEDCQAVYFTSESPVPRFADLNPQTFCSDCVTKKPMRDGSERITGYCDLHNRKQDCYVVNGFKCLISMCTVTDVRQLALQACGT